MSVGGSEENKPLKAAEPGISVVIPTYNEVENIRPLCERLFKAFKENTITKAYSDKKQVSGSASALYVELRMFTGWPGTNEI